MTAPCNRIRGGAVPPFRPGAAKAPHLWARPRWLPSGTALASRQSGDSELRVGPMDSTYHRHVTSVATGAREGAATRVLLLMLSACPVSHPAPLDRVPLTPASDPALAGRLASPTVALPAVLTRPHR